MASINYGSIISRSVAITKKARWLWVYGILLAALAGGGGNFNFPSGGGGSSDTETEVNVEENLEIPQNFPQELQRNGQEVLGRATDTLTMWLGNVPAPMWVFLILGLVILVIL